MNKHLFRIFILSFALTLCSLLGCSTPTDIQKTTDDMLKTTLEIQVSKTFFLWVVGTLGKVKITEPSNVKKEFNSFVEQINDNY